MYLQNVLVTWFHIYYVWHYWTLNFLVTNYKGHSESNASILYLNARYDIEIKQTTKCNSECVPYFCTSPSHLIHCHQEWKSFSNLSLWNSSGYSQNPFVIVVWTLPHVKWFVWDVPWELQTTRSQSVSNLCWREGVEWLQIWCSV